MVTMPPRGDPAGARPASRLRIRHEWPAEGFVDAPRAWGRGPRARRRAHRARAVFQSPCCGARRSPPPRRWLTSSSPRRAAAEASVVADAASLLAAHAARAERDLASAPSGRRARASGTCGSTRRRVAARGRRACAERPVASSPPPSPRRASRWTRASGTRCAWSPRGARAGGPALEIDAERRDSDCDGPDRAPHAALAFPAEGEIANGRGVDVRRVGERPRRTGSPRRRTARRRRRRWTPPPRR